MRKLLSVGALTAASLFTVWQPQPATAQMVVVHHHYAHHRYYHHSYWSHGRYHRGYYYYR